MQRVSLLSILRHGQFHRWVNMAQQAPTANSESGHAQTPIDRTAVRRWAHCPVLANDVTIDGEAPAGHVAHRLDRQATDELVHWATIALGLIATAATIAILWQAAKIGYHDVRAITITAMPTWAVPAAIVATAAGLGRYVLRRTAGHPFDRLGKVVYDNTLAGPRHRDLVARAGLRVAPDGIIQRRGRKVPILATTRHMNPQTLPVDAVELASTALAVENLEGHWPTHGFYVYAYDQRSPQVVRIALPRPTKMFAMQVGQMLSTGNVQPPPARHGACQSCPHQQRCWVDSA